ncbi:MAG: repair protein RecO, repair protein RecO [Candidatus Paceibacter sp.]|jgi:DNA repair protein RecO|nr:repair protein RecO, repair protein RecO [Candidatus Paceibacter sp.]
MAHHIYTTDAFVLGSELSGEADRFYLIFTKDLGLLRATARGVRLQKSKLKYSLQDFSRTRVSLVRGKEIWRITSARVEDNLHIRFRNNKSILQIVAHILSLIKRLVAGEEKNESLFMLVSDAFNFLETQTEQATQQEIVKFFEIIVVLKILHNLGYMRILPELAPFIQNSISLELLKTLEPHKALALREINTSLRETQL